LKDKIFRFTKKYYPTFLALFAVLYLFAQITGGFAVKTDYHIVFSDTAEEKIELGGYIYRDEEIIVSPYAQNVVYAVDDGQKIKPRPDSNNQNNATYTPTPVAYVYHSKTISDMANEIASLEKKIAILQRSASQDISLSDSMQTTEEIRALFASLSESVLQNDMGTVTQSSDELLMLLNRKQLQISGATNFTVEIAEIQATIDSLKRAMPLPVHEIYAERGGYFYSYTDGKEELYATENIDNLTFEEFYASKDAQKADRSSTIGKIAFNFEWYFVGEMPTDEARALVSGRYYTVNFTSTDNESQKMLLKRIITDENNEKALVVLYSMDFDEDFDFCRYQTIEIIKDSHTGYKIPSSTVRVYNGEVGVFVLRRGRAEFRRIDVLYESNGYYIVSTVDKSSDSEYAYIKLNDFVLIGKNIYEGKVFL